MDSNKRVIAMGFFDGVHIGHKALLDKTIERAGEYGVTPAVISFDTHPDRMVKGETVPLINSPYDRADLVRRYFGIDDQLFLHFDRDLMRMEWGRFIEWLVNDFEAVHLVAGYDFTFGFKGEGNTDLLAEKCKAMGVGCDIIAKVAIEGTTVSSTYIRGLLSGGEMEKANHFLGHPHTLTDTVRYGYRFGRTLGLPTINMCFPEGVLIPAHGVYASKVYLDNGREYLAVTNIGVRPTVGGEDKVSVESHILNFSGNLYGKRVRVDFYKFLRPEMKFDGTENLKQRIHCDIADTRVYFAEKS